MPELSFTEILLVAAAAVIFLKPEDLPVIARAISKAMRSVKSLMNEVKGAFDDISRESGIEQVRREIERETRMITGDDGKLYEAYDLSDFTNNSPSLLRKGEDKAGNDPFIVQTSAEDSSTPSPILPPVAGRD